MPVASPAAHSQLIEEPWDAIIVGTGVGGATLGYALARAGKRVLFCEKGKTQRAATALAGSYAEDFFDRPSAPQIRHRALLADSGRDWEEVVYAGNSKPRARIPFVGAGTGGSSALFGMALERFFPQDFTPRVSYPDEGDSLPDAWPISYDELAPYYVRAEQLYRVRGKADPLRGAGFHPEYLAPPPLTAAASELFEYLSSRGCHPYPLPMACEFRPGCQCCQGYRCARDCKNDSDRICLQPALGEFGAQLLDECEVIRLEASATRVSKVVCNWRGQSCSLQSAVVVLSAGALQTPRILFNSSSPLWPSGLANASGLVGRNLMRHYVDLFVITPKTRESVDVRLKELAFNDLYFSEQGKLGTVQSFGALPAAVHLVETLRQDLGDGPIPLIASFVDLVKPLIRRYLERALSGKLILASMVEDLPYPENRVELGADGRLVIRYQLRAAERRRIELMRAQVRRLLGTYRPWLIKQAENNQRLAHACGTCRFGVDPRVSVLDADNRAHQLDNLYVVDASFFPSSAGINPALTIAANALRVADHLVARADWSPSA